MEQWSINSKARVEMDYKISLAVGKKIIKIKKIKKKSTDAVTVMASSLLV